MKALKLVFLIFILTTGVLACSPTLKQSSLKKEEAVRIANDSLEYEIIIIDPGFNAYINGTAKPRGYHNQSYLELKNRNYVITWNYRARNVPRFNEAIYQNEIDYNPQTNYGYEVNYLLFNYFEFAQRKYNMRLGSFTTENIR